MTERAIFILYLLILNVAIFFGNLGPTCLKIKHFSINVLECDLTCSRLQCLFYFTVSFYYQDRAMAQKRKLCQLTVLFYAASLSPY